MSIIRVKKDKNYFAASNKPFNDKRLSWEARGVMGYLLSKPDDWQVRFNDLVNQGPAKRTKLRRIFKELESNGYLERERIQKEDGTIDWVSVVHETATIGRKPTHGDTIGRSPTGGSSTDGKPTHIVSTDLKKTDKQNTNKNNGSKLPRKRDPRLDNEAIVAFRAEFHRHIPIAWRGEVVDTVMDFKKWTTVIHSWNGKGWNPTNIEGMLDVYRNGWKKGKKVDDDMYDRVRKERANG